jgi:hypothetical protein
MTPEAVLDTAITFLRLRPPAGVDAGYIDGFLARNRPSLLEVVRRAMEARPRKKKAPPDPRLLAALHELSGALEERGFAATQSAVIAFRLYQEGTPLTEVFSWLKEHPGVSDPEWIFKGDVAALVALVRDDLDGALTEFCPDEEMEVCRRQVAELLPVIRDVEIAAGIPPRDLVATDGLREKPVPLDNDAVAQGDRVVTGEGRHGIVLRIHRTVMASVMGGQREVSYHFVLKLDSGREQWSSGPLFREIGDPPVVTPDVTFDGKEFLTPSDAWSKVVSAFGHIAYYAEKEENARKTDIKRKWREEGVRSRRDFEAKWRTFAAWRDQYPEVPVEGLSPYFLRLYELEAAQTRVAHEDWELEQLRKAPKDWATRWRVGDGVWVYVAEARGPGTSRGWRIVAIEGHEADIESGGTRLRVPLWMLHRDRAEDAPAAVETFTEPRWLIDLAEEMLIPNESGPRYPERAAVSRAVKQYLAEHGVEVSTRVEGGAWVTSITLKPPSGSWTESQVAEMELLLPGLRVSREEADFEPWRREGDAYDPYADYGGKQSGVMIPAAQIPAFAAILAAAMKAQGQPLNRLGEDRIAASRPAAAVVESGSRGGATTDQRQAAAEGCREIEFDLPGYGRIKVVCGQEGRRDVWHNVFVQGQRYGFNGGRWARGMVPPAAVLAAIRSRGVGVFG